MDRTIRTERLPHELCPGCSVGEYHLCVEAVRELHIPQRNVFFVSGIGYTGRGTGYVRFDSANTIHGRAIPIATGVKLIKPTLEVIAVVGDSDGAGIGASHFIHGARRNIDMAVVLANNAVHGSTGGQTAPTTPQGALTPTAPYGNLEEPFDLCELMTAAGAAYVARWTVLHTRHAINAIKKAIAKKGFGFVEIISTCPTHFGDKVLKTTNPAECLKYVRNSTSTVHQLKEPQGIGKIPLGEFTDRERTELTENYRVLVRCLVYGS